jgi:hypothetical protein
MNPPLPAAVLAAADELPDAKEMAEITDFLRNLGTQLLSMAPVASARRELYASVAVGALIARSGTLIDPDSVGRFAWSVADAVERHRSLATPPSANDADLREAPLDVVDNDPDGMG